MSSKEYMISTLHKLYRKDAWINELYNSVGAVLDGEITDQVTDDYDNLFFTSLTQVGVEMFEKDLNIIAGRGDTLEQRRKVIQSKWLAKQFSSLPVIQRIADTYFPNDIEASYDGNAMITYFVKHHQAGELDFTAFQNATGEIKPAHIGERFVYNLNKWGDYYTPINWEDFQQDLWSDVKKAKWPDPSTTGQHHWDYCLTRTWDEMITKDID